MTNVDTIVIGAGQAGLAVSRYLTVHGVEHLLVERGSVGQRWREERWVSLRLLTPNWMTRLPGWSYGGADPDGFMGIAEVVEYLKGYARSFAAPVQEQTTVERVRMRSGRFEVDTDRGRLVSENVVVATGACQLPRLGTAHGRPHPPIVQITPSTYRRPADLPEGAVLVVGASASGVQLAAELRAAGREIVLAAGRHVRLPRSYRGRDIHWWLDRLGILAAPLADRAPARRADKESRLHLSAQLVGSPDRRDVGLLTLRDAGVRLAGRLLAFDGTRAVFGDNLKRDVAEADTRLYRLLARIDEQTRHRPGLALGEPDPPAPVNPGEPIGELDLAAAGVSCIVWATGYRRAYPWLQIPVIGADGDLVHRHGVTSVPGLYAVGLPAQSRANSTFIDGVRHDARNIAGHIVARAASGGRPPAASPVGSIAQLSPVFADMI